MSDDSQPSEYKDFELPYEARMNLKEIERCLREEKYATEEMCREHIDLLENLDTEVASAIENERRVGRYNATAKHDLDKIRKFLRQLEGKLNEFDAV
jgi:DNA-binding transcriptional MerR regulator